MRETLSGIGQASVQGSHDDPVQVTMKEFFIWGNHELALKSLRRVKWVIYFRFMLKMEII